MNGTQSTVNSQTQLACHYCCYCCCCCWKPNDIDIVDSNSFATQLLNQSVKHKQNATNKIVETIGVSSKSAPKTDDRIKMWKTIRIRHSIHAYFVNAVIVIDGVINNTEENGFSSALLSVHSVSECVRLCNGLIDWISLVGFSHEATISNDDVNPSFTNKCVFVVAVSTAVFLMPLLSMLVRAPFLHLIRLSRSIVVWTINFGNSIIICLLVLIDATENHSLRKPLFVHVHEYVIIIDDSVRNETISKENVTKNTEITNTDRTSNELLRARRASRLEWQIQKCTNGNNSENCWYFFTK